MRCIVSRRSCAKITGAVCFRGSLRSLKDEATQVDAGNECGVSFLDFQAMEPDDRVEVYLPGDGSMDDQDAEQGDASE